ncbi:MAG: hypothetical protein J6U40_07690 [Kiritimatiellae bacterium]|nr:hypothetical protein [Kiritimatiellia bacterium]MBP5227376.1 hypothetical protein [Kiritimatiellia bacterium]
MTAEERQFLLTAAWLFTRHGQGTRARTLMEALVEDDPRDGVSAIAFAERLLDEGEASRALEVLRMADADPALAHAEAVLESRALRLLGKVRESESRWRRFLESRKGAARTWVAES